MSDAVVRIEKVVDEAYDTKTFVFEWDAEARPGQFVMVWVPGIDEIPMSLSGIGERSKSITVKAIGEATKALHRLTAGDALRIRGPYGNGFDLSSPGEKLIIGGGVGTAAVMPAIMATGADAIIAARSDKDIIFEDLAGRFSRNLRIATDDGSKGFHGNAVQLMREMASEKRYDCVLACGPEVMLYFTYKACQELGVKCQLSLERYMKCGAGACGCCVIDEYRVCKDGPVFDQDRISMLKEFGTSKRDACGRLVRFRRRRLAALFTGMGRPTNFFISFRHRTSSVGITQRLCDGLQIRIRGFDSLSRPHVFSTSWFDFQVSYYMNKIETYINTI